MDIFQAIEVSPLTSERIKYHLARISEAQAGSGNLGDAVADAVKEFNSFFLNYGKPYFKANKFHKNIGTPKSEEYNETLETLKEDLDRLYQMTESAAKSTVSAYNYSSITAEEIKNLALEASSKVLDLKILNDFVKGTTIVAGDDFINNSKIDINIKPETTQAGLVEGASSMGLKAVGAEKVSNPGSTTISITPVAPATEGEKGNSVNTDPTPGNIERFYEGNFYSALGEMRPEGGELRFKYVVDPDDLPPESVVKVTVNGATTQDEGIEEAQNYKHAGFYAVVASTDAEKQKIRLNMVDNNPDTFWECEYVYATPPLITIDVDPEIEVDSSSSTIANVSTEVKEISISAGSAELLAKQYDSAGRDLIVHIDYEFDHLVPMNFLVIDPVLFHTSSFIEILDVATAAEDEEFETVDGFADQMFDKILTPEANKIVNDEITGKTFASSKFSYQGLGVFSFPLRIGNKLRATILMKEPVAAVYERIHVLMQETFEHRVQVESKSSFF